jgi:hypothetical protein
LRLVQGEMVDELSCLAAYNRQSYRENRSIKIAAANQKKQGSCKKPTEKTSPLNSG